MGKLADKDIIMKETSEVCKSIKVKKQALLAKLKQDTEKLVYEKADNLERYHKGLITKEELLKRRDNITKQSKEIKQQQKELEKRICSCIEEVQNKQNGYGKLPVYYGLDVLSREMTEAFIDKIIVYNQKNIDIFWTFSRE